MSVTILKNAIKFNTNKLYGNIYIEDGRFVHEYQNTDNHTVIDASGLKIFPGIIDVHNDSIERLIVPMKKCFFLNENTIHEMIIRNFCNGITCFYFSLTISSENGVRSFKCYKQLVELISKIKNNYLYKDNIKIQLRYEITHDIRECLEELDFSNIDMICINDHSPNGIAGWTKEKYIRNLNYRCDLSNEEINDLLQKMMDGKKEIPITVRLLLDKAKEYNIPVGIHDISHIKQLEINNISRYDFAEFPLNEGMCRYFSEKNVPVVLGAPNIMLGFSRNNNISVRKAIAENLCSILCSDYHLSSLLLAPYILNNNNILSLQDAWNLVSFNPAKYFDLETKGTLEIGKDADFIIVDDSSGTPQVVATFIKGENVYVNKMYSGRQI